MIRQKVSSVTYSSFSDPASVTCQGDPTPLEVGWQRIPDGIAVGHSGEMRSGGFSCGSWRPYLWLDVCVDISLCGRPLTKIVVEADMTRTSKHTVGERDVDVNLMSLHI